MAFHGYVLITHREKNKAIKGYSEKKEKTADGKSVLDMCLVQAVTHHVKLDFNQQNGRPTKECTHNPFYMTINMDRALPELYKAMVEKWPLDINVYFFGSTPTEEKSHNWFTITMTDARVIDINLRKAMSLGHSDMPDLVDLGITYYHINWADKDDKIEADDSWAEPGSTEKAAK